MLNVAPGLTSVHRGETRCGMIRQLIYSLAPEQWLDDSDAAVKPGAIRLLAQPDPHRFDGDKDRIGCET